MVGAWLGHGWSKNLNNLGQGWGKVGAWLGTGHGWGKVEARLGHGWGKNARGNLAPTML